MCSKVFLKDLPLSQVQDFAEIFQNSYLEKYTFQRYLPAILIFRKIVIIFLGTNTAKSRFLNITNKENNKAMWHRCWSPSIKRGTNLGFNAIRVLKKNVLTFCLHKILIKCHVSISKSSIWFYRLFSIVDKILWKKVSTSRHFLNKYFLFILNIIETQ